MSVQIHGKEYITVVERVQEAGDKLLGIETEVLFQEPVVIKATVKIEYTNSATKTFTGISAANPSKEIEKMSPYEVAETSAVGRALGFAGFGVINSIASADEMIKATQPVIVTEVRQATNIEALPKDMSKVPSGPVTVGKQKVEGDPCPDCLEGVIVKNPRNGNLFCDKKCWLNK